MAKLSRDEFELLKDLRQRGGRSAIFDGKPRAGADRLVDAGFATSRALNMSSIEYEITTLGRSALVLEESGLGRFDLSNLVIEPRRFEVDGLWRIKVSSPGDPELLVDFGFATQLVERLRALSDESLAHRFEMVMHQVRG